MLFSSPIFLFCFLPIVLASYYLIRKQYRNNLLLVSSLIFFAWGGVSYTALLIISILFNYFIGLGIGNGSNEKKSRYYLIFGVVLNVLFLGVFKYADFIVSNLNIFSDSVGFKLIKQPGIILPVGISFYTFQAMSYLMDVYRKETVVQKSAFDLGLYIALFPQLIAGPIVRYHDIALQLKERIINPSKFALGVKRFIIGLGKKVLLANTMGAVADTVFATPHTEMTTMIAWLGIICYSLQIFFDFSGYSDMAIGLGKMFGFDFLENFNFPYIAVSIKDFWRRWHISLSSWFRDYLYIPLGGNRLGKLRTYINLIIVFFITGLWHGASWTFVAWGLLHGVFLMLEKLTNGRLPGVLWKPFRYVYVLFIVVMAWVLFRAETFSYAWNYYNVLFGQSSGRIDPIAYSKIINNEFYIFFVISVISATGFFRHFTGFVELKLKRDTKAGIFIAELFQTGYAVFLALILFICSVYLITNTYNPFIYYRF
jgi:alginate O-acetyltransferase complex protein AlgI